MTARMSVPPARRSPSLPMKQEMTRRRFNADILIVFIEKSRDTFQEVFKARAEGPASGIPAPGA